MAILASGACSDMAVTVKRFAVTSMAPLTILFHGQALSLCIDRREQAVRIRSL